MVLGRRSVGSIPTASKRMHWMDAWALRRKDASKGERPWGDTVCDPWVSNRETVSKLAGHAVCCGSASDLRDLAN